MFVHIAAFKKCTKPVKIQVALCHGVDPHFIFRTTPLDSTVRSYCLTSLALACLEPRVQHPHPRGCRACKGPSYTFIGLKENQHIKGHGKERVAREILPK